MNTAHRYVCRLDREGFNAMLKLTAQQLADVMAAGRNLPRSQRDAFLKAVAEELKGKEIGDGAVHLAAVRAARKVEIEAWSRRGPPAIDGTGTVPIATAK
jgi:DNA-directed RNA polymerase specialized sigma24 family protein